MNLTKIGFGGGCHWCTEAVFQSLRGVEKVEQGWISSDHENTAFSEAVIVHFNQEIIPMSILIEIHLRTHSSTSNHPMREKYRSGVYFFSKDQKEYINTILTNLQNSFDKKIITQAYVYVRFKHSLEHFKNYYNNNPEKQFCKRHIDPKLDLIMNRFSNFYKKGSHNTKVI